MYPVTVYPVRIFVKSKGEGSVSLISSKVNPLGNVISYQSDRENSENMTAAATKSGNVIVVDSEPVPTEL